MALSSVVFILYMRQGLSQVRFHRFNLFVKGKCNILDWKKCAVDDLRRGKPHVRTHRHAYFILQMTTG